MIGLLLCLLLCSCDLYNPTAGSKLSRVEISSTAKNADGGVVTCDIVAIFDKKLAEKIQKLTSQEYFQTIGTISALNKANLSIWRIEHLNKHKVSNSKTLNILWDKKPCSALLVMLFADYRSKGDHLTVIPKQTKQLNIVCGADKIENLEQLTYINGGNSSVEQELTPSQKTPSTNFVQTNI